MTIKKNTQKILLSMFADPPTPSNQLPLTACRRLIDLSDSGFRSLIYYLEAKGLLTGVKLDQTFVNITAESSSLLQNAFPALSDKWSAWDGKWSLVLFIKSIRADKQFRRLRILLSESGCQQVTRAVYLYPGELPERIKTELEQIYQDSVSVCKVSNWQYGHNPEKNYLQNNAEVVFFNYSGISKRLSQLPVQKEDQKNLTDKQIQQIFSDYDMFIETLGFDLGYFSYFFPNKIQASQVLTQFQKIFKFYFS